MRRFPRVVAVVAVAAVSIRCGSSSMPAAPAPVATDSKTAQSPATPAFGYALGQALQAAVSKRASSTAVMDGFRVHPDPAGDGLIHVVEGDGVVVNAADIASQPPAPVTYLVVNWGDSGNDRISCGACRLTHAYKPGRYTVVATTDDLQPGSAKRSTTFTVEVEPLVAPRQSPFKGISIEPNVLHVGEVGKLWVPFAWFSPSGVVIDSFYSYCPTTPFPVIESGLQYDGNGFSETLTAIAPGSCRIEIYSHDGDGNSFHDGAFLFIVP